MIKRSLFPALVAAAALAAAPVRAQEPPAQPPRVPDGVTIAGVAVGGLTDEEARAAVQTAFDQPLPLAFRRWRSSVPPARFLAGADVSGAVAAALAAAPNEALALPVTYDAAKVRQYAAALDRALSRRPRNSVLSLRRLRPYLTPSRLGFDIRRFRLEQKLVGALRLTTRTTIVVPARVLRPRITRRNYGPVVVVRRGSRRLYLYRGMRFWRRMPVAVGMPRYPTPLGRFSVIRKERNPTWNPPNTDWAAGLSPIPPGPGNPLGTRWIGLSAPGIGIHGTYARSSIGRAASHGCIRMYISHSEWLFERVRIGTRVYIVRA